MKQAAEDRPLCQESAVQRATQDRQGAVEVIGLEHRHGFIHLFDEHAVGVLLLAHQRLLLSAFRHASIAFPEVDDFSAQRHHALDDLAGFRFIPLNRAEQDRDACRTVDLQHPSEAFNVQQLGGVHVFKAHADPFEVVEAPGAEQRQEHVQ